MFFFRERSSVRPVLLVGLPLEPDARDGFKGRSIAIGPFAKYKAKFGERTEIDFGLRWAHEVHVENRMKGNAILFDITGKF